MDSVTIQFTIMRDIFIAEYQEFLDLTKDKNELFEDAAALANEVNDIRSKFDHVISSEDVKEELKKRYGAK